MDVRVGDIVCWSAAANILVRAHVANISDDGSMSVERLFTVDERDNTLLEYLCREYDVPIHCVKWLSVIERAASPPATESK